MNTKSRIGQYLMQSNPDLVEFYAPTFLKTEIQRHIPKLNKLTQLSNRDLNAIIELVYLRIQFIDDFQIPINIYSEAAKLVREVDESDVQFVALTMYLDAHLWTGDRKLYRHLLSMGFSNVVSFDDIVENI